MKNFVQSGGAIKVTAPYAVASGAGVLVGLLFGVALSAAANGAEVVVDTHGVFNLNTKAADTPAQGAAAYWDNAAKEVTTTSEGNTKIGVFTEAKVAGVTVAPVRLNGSF
jgi:predicted RecA/RadA family phage recombinase